jgi:hypothetical protein
MTMTTGQIESWREFMSEHSEEGEFNTMCDLALRGLATMPRPIEEAIIGERYLFFSHGKFRIVDTWCSPWLENHKNWPEPFTHCIPLSALESKTP